MNRDELKSGMYIINYKLKSVYKVLSISDDYIYTDEETKIYRNEESDYFIVSEEEAKECILGKIKANAEEMAYSLQKLYDALVNLDSIEYVSINENKIIDDVKDVLYQVTSKYLEEKIKKEC